MGIDVADHVLGEILDPLRGHHRPLGGKLQFGILACWTWLSSAELAPVPNNQAPSAKPIDQRHAGEQQVQRKQCADRGKFGEHRRNLVVGGTRRAGSRGWCEASQLSVPAQWVPTVSAVSY